ncbi:MAG: sodium/proline symporter [Methylococcales bacterium]|nr:sodium/proline symporter [Methylococcales bacterium]
MIISFICFMALFVAIGISSFFKSQDTKEDYYLASASISPSLVGLSAVATNNSGYMFIGIIGYTYATGLASIWLMLGWIAGDFLASTLVHARLRKATEATAEVSYAGILSHWYGQRHKVLQRTIALISLLFLLAYASAQLVAGSKALHVLFDWPMWAGAVLGSIMVVLYCFAGGIRASIWTDAAQSVVMIFSMGFLLVTAISSLGGVSNAIDQMSAIEGFMDWFPKDLALPGLAGGILFAISWMFAGLSVIGQPHVMVRFMALNDASKMRQARLWYYSWYLIFYSMATGIGLLSRIYLLDTGTFDAELALPTMAMQLLSPAFVGLILAGIFAATMSTADSLILSCSAALTHDLLPHKIENTHLLKAGTVFITIAALIWALVNSQSVFSLVIMAWSSLASAFAPLLIVLCLGKEPSQNRSLFAVFIGLGVSLLWRYIGWNNTIYEGMIGIIAGLSVFYIPVTFKKDGI